MGIRHSTVVTRPDNNTSDVSTDSWNDDHTGTGTPGKVLGFDAGGVLAELDQASGGGSSSLNIEDFGGVADFDGSTGTDNLTALEAALAAAASSGKGEILFPEGRYYVSGQIDVKIPIRFRGIGGSGMSAISLPSQLCFPQGSAGITINDWTTRGYTTEASSTSAAGVVIDTLRIQSGTDAQVAGSLFGAGASYDASAEADGILLRARARITNCQIVGFKRHGIAVLAGTDGNPLLGNANNWHVDHNRITQNGASGLHIEGTDANAGVSFFNDISINRRWGIYDAGFLANAHYGNHMESNGIGNGTTDLDGICAYPAGGQRYAVVIGQETAAATTTPGTNSAIWYPVAGSNGGRTWSSGFQVISGGPIATTNGSPLFGGYHETGQGPAQLTYSAMYHVSALSGQRGGTQLNHVGDDLGVNSALWLTGTGAGLRLEDTTNSSSQWYAHHDSGTLYFEHTASGKNVQFNTGANIAVMDSFKVRCSAVQSTGATNGVFIDSRSTGASYQLYNVAGVLGFHNGADRMLLSAAGDLTIGGGLTVNSTLVLNGSGILQAAAHPALTGDVTNSAGSLAMTIANGAVSLAKMANMATASLIYRKTAGTGAPEVQTLATLKTDLGLTGTNSGDQTSIVGITGTIAQFNTAITDADIVPTGAITSSGLTMATSRLLGRTTASTGAIEELTASAAKTFLAIASTDVSGLGTAATKNISVGTSAPGSPSTNDLWVDTN